VATGATAVRVAERMAISLRTLQRWRRQFAGDGDGGDRRKGSARHVVHRLSHQERQQILAVCNEPPYASLPPAQIVPALADQGEFVASESSFYRVLHSHQQVQRRGRARPPQEPRPVPRRRADGPNQLWSWDITYLPTSVRGVWLYLYLVVDVWSRKIVAWDVAEREDAQVAADLISRACIRERISKRRQRRLRWVPFTGQFQPLTSLTPGGRNRVLSQYRPHGEFCLPGSCAVLHGSTSTESGPG